jgi:hypothetical protein
MKAEEHIECARQWGRAAELAEQASLALVLPHARFYEAANYVEAMLAERKLHPEGHLERIRAMYDSGAFSFDEVQFFEKVTRQRAIVEFQMPSRPLKELVESGNIFRRRWERLHGEGGQGAGPAAPPGEQGRA